MHFWGGNKLIRKEITTAINEHVCRVHYATKNLKFYEEKIWLLAFLLIHLDIEVFICQAPE